MSGDYVTLFDGTSLDGWHAAPRIPAPERGRDRLAELSAEQRARVLAHSGKWTIEEGAVCGRQDPPGSGLGAYLISNETYQDFELVFEARPDWPADTGIMLRATAMGSQGYQVLLDHRKSGNIGGFYGNGIGRFHAVNFNLDVTRDADGRPDGLVLEDPATTLEPINETKRSLLAYAASGEQFLDAWRWDDWNEFRITVQGEFPTITTIINGVKIAQFIAEDLPSDLFDRVVVSDVLGSRGHIAFEVHDNDPGMGAARWAPDAACRWRNIRLREL